MPLLYIAGVRALSTAMRSALASEVLRRVTDPQRTAAETSTTPLDALHLPRNRLHEVLLNSHRIFPAVARHIARARRSVCMLFFVWDSGADAARCLMDAVREAQERRRRLRLQGRPFERLHVRLLVNHSLWDDCNGQGFPTLERWLRANPFDHELVHVQIGAHLHLLNDAIHSKYVLVDAQRALVTGDNVYHLSDFETERSWFDAGFILSGDVVHVLQREFDQYWRAYVNPHWAAPSTAPSTAPAPASAAAPNAFPAIYLPKRACSSARMHLRLPVDGAPAGRFASPQTQGFAACFQHARRVVCYVTPALNAAPVQGCVRAALANGAQVLVLTSAYYERFSASVPFHGGGAEVSLHRWARDAALRAAWERGRLQVRYFSRDGATLPRTRESCRNHTKLLLVDDEVALVGSANGDTQSWLYSAESNVLLDDRAAAARIRQTVFEPLWRTSLPQRPADFASAARGCAGFWAMQATSVALLLLLVLLLSRFVLRTASGTWLAAHLAAALAVTCVVVAMFCRREEAECRQLLAPAPAPSLPEK